MLFSVEQCRRRRRGPRKLVVGQIDCRRNPSRRIEDPAHFRRCQRSLLQPELAKQHQRLLRCRQNQGINCFLQVGTFSGGMGLRKI